ncbi:MAG: GNAT family N-acetyltransferase [Burkholderiales bacterium]|nr:GNAT family N-acetyltransferase [Burkholderiales bacterium]
MTDFRFATLENISNEVLLPVCNAAFADYIVPMQLDLTSLANTQQRRGFDASLSVGAFVGDELVAFHLICKGDWQGKQWLYDTMTGTVPSARGQGLAKRMFEWVMPRWREAGYTDCLLEVFCENHAARKSYEAMGFEVTRQFECARLETLAPLPLPPGVVVEQLDSKALPPEFASWLDEAPGWQNSLDSVRRTPQQLRQVRLLVQGRPAAVGLVVPQNGDVPVFAVAPKMRRRGLGGALLASLRGVSDKPLRFIMMTADSPSLHLIESVGGERHDRLQEMAWHFG